MAHGNQACFAMSCGLVSRQLGYACHEQDREAHGKRLRHRRLYNKVSRESSTLVANVCREHKWRLTANKSYAINLFGVSALPRAAHGKRFAESKLVFAVRNRLTAKPVIPVVD
jgi:hypothetical protein